MKKNLLLGATILTMSLNSIATSNNALASSILKDKTISQTITTKEQNYKDSNCDYSDSTVKLLSCLIYSEANTESYSGKLAVANVVLNRVANKDFSDTIYGVIYENKQFAVVNNGSLEKALNNYSNFTSESEKNCIKAAKAALDGENNIGNCLYFRRHSQSIENSHPNGTKIDNHYFW